MLTFDVYSYTGCLTQLWGQFSWAAIAD